MAHCTGSAHDEEFGPGKAGLTQAKQAWPGQNRAGF
jgi:hypothetical protein